MRLFRALTLGVTLGGLVFYLIEQQPPVFSIFAAPVTCLLDYVCGDD